MSDLQGKRLLLIAPMFFDYYKEIMNEAESLGMQVDYVCDAPSNSNWSKAIGRVNKKFILLQTKKYFENKVKPQLTDKDYDYVLVVAAMSFALTADMVRYLREKFAKAKFVIYQWDSEKNLKMAVGVHKYFDAFYSFDTDDCKNSPKYTLLPLFYTRTYENVGSEKKVELKYDCSYVGTAHPKKLRLINEMADRLHERYPKQFIYHYMPSVLKYIYHKVLSKDYRNAKLSDFKTEKLSMQQIMDVFYASRFVLDSPQDGQIGLTMRTIECLGAKKKLITANVDIKNYDFYLPENIYVYDGVMDLENVFFKTDYKELTQEIYQKYALRNWLRKVLQ